MTSIASAATSAESKSQWVTAGLCLCRVAPIDGALAGRALSWLTAVLSEAGALPPPGFVIDVALLLGGAPLDTSHAQLIDEHRLRGAVARYEDRVLGRLAADRRLAACRDAYARLDEELRVMAVGVLVASLLRRTEGLAPVEPGVLRKLRRRDPDDVVAAGFEAWRESPAVLAALADGYSALSERARSTPSLLTDADVFTLEHLDMLGELGQRVAITQIVDAAEAVAKNWPRRIKLRSRALGPTPTALEDESAYPAGGFTSVQNHGALENLLTSELVYMDDVRDAGVIDLFDVRYAEGELLYYTRDEALIVRPRRLIAFVLDPSLARARLKDAGVAWQRVVVVLGWMLAAIRCLERWLGETELRFVCVIERGEGELGALAHEGQLVELLLTEWREKGAAELVTLSRAAWRARLSEEAQRADVRVAVVGVDVACELEDERLTGITFDAHQRDWGGWCRDGLETLRVLV